MSKIFESDELKNQEIISEIKSIILNDGVVIYPTDTVYGLGADFKNKKSLDKIYDVKERKKDSPLIALLSNRKYLEKIAIINESNRGKIEKLTKKYWPGGLTIILDKKEIVPSNMVSNGTSVGVRIPNHEISIELIEACGGILATTSANISGEESPKLYEDLSEKIKSRVDLLIKLNLKKDSSPKGVESTIVDMRKNPKILREGSIKREEIEKIIGKVE